VWKSLPSARRWTTRTPTDLLRAYPSLEALQRSQDAFYGSDEWREGPREAIVSRIESGSSVVLPASAMLDYTR
jgi:hypothetical protein